MELPGPTFNDSDHSVELTIDLNELFGAEVDQALAEVVGTEIRDQIVAFAENGRNAKGKSFKKYDEDYIESEEFRAAGKSENDVNMTLYGDMLSQLEIIRNEQGVITLGWEDSTQKKKAYAHMTGFKGHPTIKNGPKREFLVVSQKLLGDVKDRFIDEVGGDREGVSTLLTALSIFQQARRQEEEGVDSLFYSLIFGERDDQS